MLSTTSPKNLHSLSLCIALYYLYLYNCFVPLSLSLSLSLTFSVMADDYSTPWASQVGPSTTHRRFLVSASAAANPRILTGSACSDLHQLLLTRPGSSKTTKTTLSLTTTTTTRSSSPSYFNEAESKPPPENSPPVSGDCSVLLTVSW